MELLNFVGVGRDKLISIVRGCRMDYGNSILDTDESFGLPVLLD